MAGKEVEDVTTVAIIGTGSVGAALGRGWSGAGFDVVFGTRSADDPDGETVTLASETGARLLSPREAAETGDTVVLAVPGSVVEAVVADLASAIGNEIVIDCTNGPVPTSHESIAESVAAAVPDARVAKAFNTIGANRMTDPVFPDGIASMFVCGDEEAIDVAADLASALGFDAVSAGDLTAARHLEALAHLWIHLAGSYGRDIGFRLLGARSLEGE